MKELGAIHRGRVGDENSSDWFGGAFDNSESNVSSRPTPDSTSSAEGPSFGTLEENAEEPPASESGQVEITIMDAAEEEQRSDDESGDDDESEDPGGLARSSMLLVGSVPNVAGGRHEGSRSSVHIF